MDNHAFTVQPGSLVPPAAPGSEKRLARRGDRRSITEICGVESIGKQVYYAYHEWPDCDQMCSEDPPDMSTFMIDNFQRQVMRLFRPTKCKVTCAAQTEAFIEAPIGTRIGSVRHKPGFGNRDFWVTDAEGKSVLQILGPADEGTCCAEYKDRVFKITTLVGAEIGEIHKKYMGYMVETYTDIDNFTVNFPMDLDVRTKATLIGATFLIDMLYYTNDQTGRRRY